MYGSNEGASRKYRLAACVERATRIELVSPGLEDQYSTDDPH
jgi:hypothetical protein